MRQAGQFRCSIVTPDGKVFEGPVDFVAMPAHDGEIGILPNRAPLLAKLGIGVLRAHQGPQRHVWFIDGGFGQMVDNSLTILTRHALKPEAIEVSKAEADLAAARKMRIRSDEDLAARTLAMTRARTLLRLACSRRTSGKTSA